MLKYELQKLRVSNSWFLFLLRQRKISAIKLFWQGVETLGY